MVLISLSRDTIICLYRDHFNEDLKYFLCLFLQVISSKIPVSLETTLLTGY